MKDNKKIIKAVLAYIGNYKILLFVSLLMAMITVVLTLYLPILFGDAIDLIVGRGQTKFDRIFKIIITAAIVAGTTSLFQWLMTTINNKIAYNVVRDIRNDAFKRIERLPLSYLDSHSTGDIVSRVIADADQFKRVINNLISNSKKYASKDRKGRIDIRVEAVQKFVMISVEDNGIGIPKERLARVFERLYRVDESRNSKIGGSGLGLAIVKKIIEDHSGRVWAESNDGDGTKIVILLRNARFTTIKEVEENRLQNNNLKYIM